MAKYYVVEWPRPVGLENIIRIDKPDFNEELGIFYEAIHEFSSIFKAYKYIRDYNKFEEIIIKTGVLV